MSLRVKKVQTVIGLAVIVGLTLGVGITIRHVASDGAGGVGQTPPPPIFSPPRYNSPPPQSFRPSNMPDYSLLYAFKIGKQELQPRTSFHNKMSQYGSRIQIRSYDGKNISYARHFSVNSTLEFLHLILDY